MPHLLRQFWNWGGPKPNVDALWYVLHSFKQRPLPECFVQCPGCVICIDCLSVLVSNSKKCPFGCFPRHRVCTTDIQLLHIATKPFAALDLATRITKYTSDLVFFVEFHWEFPQVHLQSTVPNGGKTATNCWIPGKTQATKANKCSTKRNPCKAPYQVKAAVTKSKSFQKQIGAERKAARDVNSISCALLHELFMVHCKVSALQFLPGLNLS